jgi:hypothetical protein
MMFCVNKKSALVAFKIVAICSMVVMLSCFISNTMETQKYIETSDDENVTPNHEQLNFRPCYTEYVIYCFYALFLGAFINVKRLVKLGVI